MKDRVRQTLLESFVMSMLAFVILPLIAARTFSMLFPGAVESCENVPRAGVFLFCAIGFFVLYGIARPAAAPGLTRRRKHALAIALSFATAVLGHLLSWFILLRTVITRQGVSIAWIRWTTITFPLLLAPCLLAGALLAVHRKRNE